MRIPTSLRVAHALKRAVRATGAGASAGAACRSISATLLGVLLAAAAPAVLLDRIAVTVGNTVITESEIDQEIRLTDFLNNQPLDLSAKAKRAAAERLIDQHLIRQDMQVSQWPQPEASEATKLLQEFQHQRFDNHLAAYRAALTRYGITETELKQHLLWQLAALRYTDFRFQPNVPAATPTMRRELSEETRERSHALARQTHPTSPQPQLQLGKKPPPQTDQSGAPPREETTPQNPVPESVDQQMEAWLKEARSRVRIVYHQEAFQ